MLQSGGFYHSEPPGKAGVHSEPQHSPQETAGWGQRAGSGQSEVSPLGSSNRNSRNNLQSPAGCHAALLRQTLHRPKAIVMKIIMKYVFSVVI